MKQKVYYIYEIPGVKIGCTTNVQRRVVKKQGFTEYKILETHTDIKVAGQRERELQKEYEYTIDKSSYDKAFAEGPTEIRRKTGSRVLTQLWEERRDRMIEITKQNGQAVGGSPEGKKRMSELGKTYGKANGEKHGANNFKKSNDRRRESGDLARVSRLIGLKTGGLTWKRLNQEKWLCPDGKITSKGNVKKYCLNRNLDPTKATKIIN